MINKIKRQPSEQEKIIANETSDKELISRTYKQLVQLNIRETNSPIKNWAEDLKRHFSKEKVQMVNKHTRRCSALLTIREMHIRTTMRYHFTPARMSINKKIYKLNAGEGVEEREPSCTVGGNANRYNHYGE